MTRAICFYVFLAILCCSTIPLGSNRTWALALLELAVFGVMAVMAVTVISSPRINLPELNWRSIKFGYLFNAGLFFTALMVMCLRQLISDESADIATGQATLIEALLYAGVFALTLTFLKDKKSIQTLIYAIVGIGLVQAFLGSYWVIVGTQGRASGTFVNPNHLAGFLEMSIGLGVGMMLSIHSTKGTTFRTSLLSWSELLLGPKARLRVVLIIMVIAVVMSASRSGNTALFSSILITAITMLIIARKLNRSTIILLVSLVVIDVALIGTYFGVERVANRIQQTTLATEQRDEVSIYTIEIIKDNLLWGTGAGTFEHVFPKYRGPDVGNHFTHAENDYLQFLSELGLAGFIPLALIVMFSYGAAIQALRVRKSQFYRGIAFGTLMAMNSILIHSFTDFNLRIPANACLFMVVLALGWVSLYSERGGKDGSALRRQRSKTT